MNKIITIILFVFFLNYFSNAYSVPMQRNDINNSTRVDFLKRGVTFLKRDIQTVSYTLQAQGCWNTYCGATVAAAPPCPAGSVSSYITTGCVRIDGTGTTWLDQTFVSAAGWVCPTSYPRAMVSLRICTVAPTSVAWVPGSPAPQIQIQYAPNSMYLQEGAAPFGSSPTVLKPTSSTPITYTYNGATPNSYFPQGLSGVLSLGTHQYTDTYGGDELMVGNSLWDVAIQPNPNMGNSAKLYIQQSNSLSNIKGLTMESINGQQVVNSMYGTPPDNFNIFVPACQQDTIILNGCGSGCYSDTSSTNYGAALSCPADHPYSLNTWSGNLNCDCNVMGYCGEDTKQAELFSTSDTWCCPTGYPYAACSVLQCGTCSPTNNFYISAW